MLDLSEEDGDFAAAANAAGDGRSHNRDETHIVARLRAPRREGPAA